MPEAKLTLIKGDRVTNYDYHDSLPVNMLAVSRDINGDSGYMISHDGLTEFAQTGGVARGATYNERFDKHFRISGNNLESIGVDGSVTKIGETPGTGIASMAASFNTQAIVSDGKMWLYDNATLTQISDPQLGTPIDIEWFRGIYVLTDGESVYQTDINNEYSISPLKYAGSEFAADPIKGLLRTDYNEIMVFNRYSTEYFYFNPNAAVGTSVLFPVQGKSTKIGIVSTHCKCELDGMVFILGGRKEESTSIHILNGSKEQTIATREIDKILATYTEDDLQNVYMESRTKDRNKLVIIHLPEETLIYNHSIATAVGPQSAWSFVKSGGNDYQTWRGKYGLFDPRVGKWIYGDTQENKLGYLDDSTAAQYGEDVESILYTPIIDIDTISINKFEIDTITGFAPDSFASAFSLSYDGISYGREYWNKISVNKEYGRRYIARRLGFIRDEFSMRFRFISKHKMAFSAVRIDYD